MATPEWTAVEQGMRSRRIARYSIVTVLVALGVLAGTGLGIPIGRDQQVRVDAQRPSESREWQDELPRGLASPPNWLAAAGEGDAAAPVSLPPLPQLESLPAAVQQAFNRFHCAAASPAASAQCAALAVLRADSRFEPGEGSAPALTPGGHDGAYTQGQPIALAVKATSAFDGYLYVDYFDSTGAVYHLRPGLKSAGTPLTHDAWLQFGQSQGYYACPPFGVDLVTAISTPRPIFAQERPYKEPAEAYLAALHARLQEMVSDGDAPALSGYTAVVTFARDGANL